MGYRSDVMIATTREAYDEFLEIMDYKNENVFAEGSLIGSDIAPQHFEEKTGCVVFGWRDIRWYEGLFLDVHNVIDALEEIGFNGHPYEFCRVGEECDDIEYRTVNENESLALHVEPNTTIDIVGT